MGDLQQKLVGLNIRRDGNIKASDLESILNAFANDLVRAFEQMGEATATELKKLRDESQGLRRDLDTERRLRLGQGKRQ